MKVCAGDCGDGLTPTMLASCQHYIENQELKFKLYPNPANSYLMVDFNKKIRNATYIEIYDKLGKLVSKDGIQKGIDQFMIDTKKLSGGMYFMNVVSKEGKLSGKFIIEK